MGLGFYSLGGFLFCFVLTESHIAYTCLNSMCSQRWPWTLDLPASDSPVELGFNLKLVQLQSLYRLLHQLLFLGVGSQEIWLKPWHRLAVWLHVYPIFPSWVSEFTKGRLQDVPQHLLRSRHLFPVSLLTTFLPWRMERKAMALSTLSWVISPLALLTARCLQRRTRGRAAELFSEAAELAPAARRGLGNYVIPDWDFLLARTLSYSSHH